MRQVFEGEIYEILPISNGILFSYKKDEIEENVVVSYKMISFDTGRITDVTNATYLMTKFGTNYKAVCNFCENKITVKSILLPAGKVFLLSGDGSAVLLDNDITPVWTGKLVYRSAAASDIALYDGALWATFSDKNVLLKYDLSTMKEELRIGGKTSPFDKPKDIFIDGDKAIISNSGSMKLTAFSFKEYDVSDYACFEEPVFQFISAGGYKFVLLRSGLYVI